MKIAHFLHWMFGAEHTYAALISALSGQEYSLWGLGYAAVFVLLTLAWLSKNARRERLSAEVNALSDKAKQTVTRIKRFFDL